MTTDVVDVKAALTASLTELHLPTVRRIYEEAARLAERETLSYERYLLDLVSRESQERQQKRIPGSVGIPLNHLVERLQELPADRQLLVHCAGGYRSSIAASLLQRHGFTQVSEIAGGIAAWDAAKLPLET